MQTVGQIDTAPFEKGAKAILWTSYNGQTQGTAVGRILTGAANPSGRLTTTWYDAADLEKMPINAEQTVAENGASRYYNNYNIQQANGFPGRTTSTIRASRVPVRLRSRLCRIYILKPDRLQKRHNPRERLTVSVDVPNTGDVPGKETVQLYVSFRITTE